MSALSEIDDEENQLAWEQRPLKELLRLAWPIAISTLSFSFKTLMDTLFVGWLGSHALAGVGLGGTAAFFLLCFAFGVLRGAKVLISQAVGAGRTHVVGAYVGAALVLAALLSVAVVALGQLGALFISDLLATEEAGAAAKSYFAVRVLSAPVILQYAALREGRYGQGDSRSPMVAALLGNVVNVVLDYVFIFTLDMGVAGAAWASLVAAALEWGLLLYVQLKSDVSLAQVRWRHVVQVWRMGLAPGLQFLLEVGSFAIMAVLIAKLSEAQMSAHQIALQVTHLSFLPAFALAEAASVLVGQAVGAGRFWLVRLVARLAVVSQALYTGTCSVLLIFVARPIAAVFTKDPVTLEVTENLLYVAAAFNVFDGAYVVARAVLRGTGDVRYPAIVGIIIAWVLTPPLTWLLGYQAGWGAAGGWFGLCGEIILGAGILWWRLERGHWKPVAEAAREQVEHSEGERELAEASA